DKANALSKELFGFFEERTRYYLSFKDKKGQVKPEIDDHMQIMGYLSQMAEFNKQTDLAKELKTKLDSLQAGI
ncbi:MAG: hypothetical protein ACOVO9_13840, partial [Bacteroidia bacterium]